jgi:hypothetical protein
MAYDDTNGDSADARYREKVRGRLIRTDKGLSFSGMIGIAIVVAIGVIYFSIPAVPHHPGKAEADVRRAASICDRMANARDDDRCLMPSAPLANQPPY